MIETDRTLDTPINNDGSDFQQIEPSSSLTNSLNKMLGKPIQIRFKGNSMDVKNVTLTGVVQHGDHLGIEVLNTTDPDNKDHNGLYEIINFSDIRSIKPLDTEQLKETTKALMDLLNGVLPTTR